MKDWSPKKKQDMIENIISEVTGVKDHLKFIDNVILMEFSWCILIQEDEPSNDVKEKLIILSQAYWTYVLRETKVRNMSELTPDEWGREKEEFRTLITDFLCLVVNHRDMGIRTPNLFGNFLHWFIYELIGNIMPLFDKGDWRTDMMRTWILTSQHDLNSPISALKEEMKS